MNYIPAESDLPAFVLTLLPYLSALFILGLGLTIYAFNSEKGTPAMAWSGLVAIVIGAVSVGMWIANSPGSSFTIGPQREAVGAEVERVYGISLNQDQIRDLKYPIEQPDAELKNFGSTDLITDGGDGELQRSEVFLVWWNGEMILADTDGQPLTPLDAR